ncbi:MAG: DUF2662 domain-containing protein [Armatimonadia bacterium]|nr:DUF2662 domain-containing protein [Armatimonadia bacterium]
MSILSKIERGIRGAMESVFGRAFGGGLQPTEIRRRLMTEATASERAAEGGSRVANYFTVDLCPSDMEGLGPDLPILGADLIEQLEDRAHDSGWETEGPFDIRFQEHRGYATGQFDVRAEWRGGVPGLRVEVEAGPDKGQTFEVAANGADIGRDPDCAVALTDTDVSRRHASLVARGWRVDLRDLGSTNGTFLQGRRVEDTPLPRSANVEVGRSRLSVTRSRPVWEDRGDNGV